jgi:RHS repeat-associated protein
VSTETGRVRRISATSYSYEHTLTDHLGNGRVYFDMSGGAVRKIQETDYYAFGLDIQRNLVGVENKFQYNGKEKQDQEKMYDYGARFYDPVIGRWNVVDALSDHPNQIDKSPYAYAWNNPINLKDPDGNCPQCIIYAAEFLIGTVAIITAVHVINNGRNYIKNNSYSLQRDDYTSSSVDYNKATVKKESKTEKDPTGSRVTPRKGTLAKVKDAQPKNEDGEMLDPNTGKPLDPEKTDLGHKKGQEWKTRKEMHKEKGSTRKEVIEAENDASLYQYEDRGENRSRKHEEKPKKQ